MISRDCYCAIICFDPEEEDCLQKVQEFKEIYLDQNNSYKKIFYVATKNDLWKDKPLPYNIQDFINDPENDVIITSVINNTNFRVPFEKAAAFCAELPFPTIEEEQELVVDDKKTPKKSCCS